jgi:beta-lactamase class A/beta-lactamase class A CARB-5
MKPATTVLLVAALTVALPIFRASAADDPIAVAVEAAENSLNARIGVAIHDTGSGRWWLHRANERFPMASTSKTLVCAALLDAGAQAVERQIEISEEDILEYAPVTKAMVGHQASGSDLCAATLRTSDNTAVNKVLEVLGGPHTITSFLRKIGDEATRLDRNEPGLNEATPGDLRDTTTPRAMSTTLQKLVLGDVLDPAARSVLAEWLRGNEVGGPLLRAGLPKDWVVADRTGAGGQGTRGVTAVLWPPGRAPVVAAIYITGTDASMVARNAAIASIGTALASVLR